MKSRLKTVENVLVATGVTMENKLRFVGGRIISVVD